MTQAFSDSGEPEIILDLSRLISRILHPTPTGVDRCEMAYARGLLGRFPARLHFAAIHPSGHYGRLSPDAVQRFLDLTEQRWENHGFRSKWEKRRFVAYVLATLFPRPWLRRNDARRAVYVQASPNNLVDPEVIKRILARERARFLCLVHDLIPLEFPEYARVEGAAKHKARIETIVNNASGIILNSHATLASLQPWLDCLNRLPELAVSHLGTHVSLLPQPRRPKQPERPYFVCIGTIEPRKNHLLLLNIWRRLANEHGPLAIPKLVLIGRRGWENEQIVDMLDRCPALAQCVEEMAGLPDQAAAELLIGARALLLPSFAEGYGMPVAEALQLGTPVICSDLPALREVGGDVPEFIDPLDGIKWIEAVRDYASDGLRRHRQLERLRGWSSPTWDKHIDIVVQMADTLSR